MTSPARGRLAGGSSSRPGGRPAAVADLLRRRGPSLSSEVLADLRAAGVSDVAARKRVERAGGDVRRLTGVHFGHNRRFLYLEEQFGTERFWRALVRQFDASGSVYGLACAALEARGGAVPDAQFAAICGSPLALRGHVAAERVRDTLLNVGLLRRRAVAGFGTLVEFTGTAPEPALGWPAIRARRLAEEVFLGALRDWLRRNGLASDRKVAVREGDGTPPEFGQFRWDLTAPSYAHPLADRRGRGGAGAPDVPNPGFVVADVVLGSELTRRHVGAVLQKCDLLRRQQRLRPALCLLVADGFARDAFELGRQRGIVFTTPNNFLGREVAEALTALIAVLTDAGRIVSAQPERVEKLVRQLSAIDGRNNNLRGALFELLVGMCVRQHEGTRIEMGKRVRDPETGEDAEIDVLRVRERSEVWAYECKGRNPHQFVRDDEVKDWLERQVPRIASWARQESWLQGHKLHVAFWTSGRFAPEAASRLEQAGAATQRYAISWRDGSGVQAYVDRMNDGYAKKVFDEHFANHPLSRHFRPESAPPPADAEP